MKLFNKKSGLTLSELVISIAIIGALIVIIFVFVDTNIEELANNTSKIKVAEDSLNLENTFEKYLTLGYTDKNIIEISGDNPNSVLFMKKPDNSEGILVGIVNVNSGTLQREYVYGDNFIGYRELSQSEIAEIEGDKNSVFTKVFYIDKVFLNLRAKDFYLEVYNSGSLINLDFSVVKTFNKDSFGLEFSSFDIEEIVIYEYSLVL